VAQLGLDDQGDARRAILLPVRSHEDDSILAVLRRALPGLVAVYRFGSSSTPRERPESDLDVAVLATERLDARLRFDLAQRLASDLRREVDLLDLRTVPTVIAMQAVGKGRLVADLDPAARRTFETYLYSDYARLNEERRPILERVAREGRVYAR